MNLPVKNQWKNILVIGKEMTANHNTAPNGRLTGDGLRSLAN